MKTKQQIQSLILSRTKVRNNILKVWNQANFSEKSDWYGEAYDFCKSHIVYPENDPRFTMDLNRFIGIVAATSPMKSWECNKKLASKMWRTGIFSGHTKVMCLKAKRIFESDGSEGAILDILNGNKISAFFLNIRYPENSNNLTIDRHAICIALGKKHLSDEEMPQLTAIQYEFFVQCYNWTALQLGISGTRLQSATWVAHKRLKKS